MKGQGPSMGERNQKRKALGDSTQGIKKPEIRRPGRRARARRIRRPSTRRPAESPPSSREHKQRSHHTHRARQEEDHHDHKHDHTPNAEGDKTDHFTTNPTHSNGKGLVRSLRIKKNYIMLTCTQFPGIALGRLLWLLGFPCLFLNQGVTLPPPLLCGQLVRLDDCPFSLRSSVIEPVS